MQGITLLLGILLPILYGIGKHIYRCCRAQIEEAEGREGALKSQLEELEGQVGSQKAQAEDLQADVERLQKSRI